MSDKFNLSDRKRDILLNAVGNYIDNAMPITSGSVQNSAFNSLSSATLRNELNALEEMGYLKQLHTSGGRIPTSKGYKFYVDCLLASRKFDSDVVDSIKNKFEMRSNFILDVVDGLAKNVSEVLKLPTFISMQNYDSLSIKGINIIPLITGQALVLVQTDAGIVNNTINLSDEVTEDNCKDASKFLSLNLCNKKIKHILENIDYYNNLFKLKSACIKLIISALLGNQILMATALNNSAVIKHHYYVRIHNGRKSVRDYEYRSTLHQLIHAALNYRFGTGVYRRCRLVKYHYGWVGNGGARNRDKLTLSL